MSTSFLKGLLLGAVLCCAAPAFADADATLSQVYDAAKSGHMDQAQQMMAQVLKDHPESAKAHYVEAELDAKQHQYAAARTELGAAERLQPGLPFAKPESVRALQAEIGSSSTPAASARESRSGSSPSIPWVPVFVLIGMIAVIWMVIRGRRNAVRYSSNPMVSANGMPPPGYGGPGYGQNVGGGMGSGIAGGLASGLAVGAGVVAGEELAHHFLDGDRRAEGTRFENDNRPDVDPNSSMGGSDFGVADNSSWDDSSSSSADFGGGGDDWS